LSFCYHRNACFKVQEAKRTSSDAERVKTENARYVISVKP
jgi:hypothetical protein